MSQSDDDFEITRYLCCEHVSEFYNHKHHRSTKRALMIIIAQIIECQKKINYSKNIPKHSCEGPVRMAAPFWIFFFKKTRSDKMAGINYHRNDFIIIIATKIDDNGQNNYHRR